jgi:hypothetical protein
LADGVVRFLSQADFRRSAAAEGHALVEKEYTLGAMLDRTEALYARVFAARPTPRPDDDAKMVAD